MLIPQTTATIEAIKKALQAENMTLTTDDLMKITFASATLRPYTSVAVLATITVGTATATKDLSLTIAATDQEKADRIKNRITNVDLNIPAGTNPDTTNLTTIQVIKTALEGANPALTTEDLATISFSDATLQAGASVVVKATITVGQATAEKDLNVTLAQSDQQQADAIKAKINDVDLTVPAGTNPDTTTNATIDAIKVVLEADNVSLSVSDLNYIGFSDTTLQAGSSVTVIATITVGSATATKDLNVTLAQTDQQKANAIKDKITNVGLTIPAGTNPDTSNAATITAIKNALETENQTLTVDDLSTITLANTTLQAGSSVTVTATITVGSATATKNLNVTLAQSDQQKADAIKDKITNDTFNIRAGTNPDTTNTATITAIKTALQNANRTLTGGDLSTIAFASTTLQAGSSVTVIATITVGSATATIDLNVTLTQTDQQKVDAIKAKITNVDLTVPAGTNPNTNNTDTLASITTALLSENPTLTRTDLTKIFFAGTTLKVGSSVVVRAYIGLNRASATVDLNVTIAQTDQQKADAIKDRMFKQNIDIRLAQGSPTSFYSTNTPQVRDDIKSALRQENSLTADEAQALSVETGVALSNNTPQPMVITIRVGQATTQLTISVTLILY